MRFLKKVEASSASEQAVRHLMQTARQVIGNKRYMHDIEAALEKAVEAGVDLKDLHYLARDLQSMQIEASRKAREPWRK